ncbi:MAG: ribonuclease P protein component [Candidatus Saccharimonas aalborgensis]
MIENSYRFHGHGSLKFVYKKADTYRSRLLTVKYIHNPHRANSRFAVVVSKKVHKSAVGRNRIRRRIYEILRAELPHLQSIHDIAVIVISGETLTASHQELAEVIRTAFRQTGVYKPVDQ